MKEPIHRWLYIYLPSLVCAKVECEVNTCVSCEGIEVAIMKIERVVSADACQWDDFEFTWLTLVTQEEVCCIDSTDELTACTTNQSLMCIRQVAITSIEVSLYSSTPNWSKPLSETYTY